MVWSGSLLNRHLRYRDTTFSRSALGHLSLLVGIVLILPGCTSFGPPSVDRDRFDYINAIASSWKQQTLLNIVKMRYADTPVFLEVGQIISGYQLEGTVGMSGSLSGSSSLSI